MVDYQGNAAAHLFGDSAPALARMRASAVAAGVRILSAASIDDGGAFVAPPPGGALLIELAREEASDAVLALLDLAEQEAVRGSRRSVVSGPPSLIDLIAARAGHADVAHLCDADDEERRTAVADAVLPVARRLHDVVREEGKRFLQPPVGETDEVGLDAASIRAMLRARRQRDLYFPADLFADPAWDMLLDLMAARLEGRQVAISSLCIAAYVPATTALRWIKALTEQGLFERIPDPADGRRVHIALSDETAGALGACLGQMRRTAAAMTGA
jgi:Winged helix DNA-binding domain